VSTLAPFRLSEAADSLVKASTPEPVGHGGHNWVTKTKPGNKGELPPYIQHVANDLKAKHGESQAIGMAVGIVKNWKDGHDGKGNKVDATTQAAAAKAIAEWEKLKATNAAGKAAGKAAGALKEAVRRLPTRGVDLSDRVALRTAARARLRAIEDAFGLQSMVALLEAKAAPFAPELRRVASAQREKERLELHVDGQHVGTVMSRKAYDPAKPDQWAARSINGRTIGDGMCSSKAEAVGLVQKHLEDAPGRITPSPTEGRFLVAEPQNYGGATTYREFPSESSARFEAGLPEKKTKPEQGAEVAALGETIAFDLFTLDGLAEELPSSLAPLAEVVVLWEDFHSFDPGKHPRGVHGKFAKGDRVNYQHSMFGRVPAEVTSVTSRRVHVKSSDPRVRPTSMTHKQASDRLSVSRSAQATIEQAPRVLTARKVDRDKMASEIAKLKVGDRPLRVTPFHTVERIKDRGGRKFRVERKALNKMIPSARVYHDTAADVIKHVGEMRPVREGASGGGVLDALLDRRVQEAALTTKERKALPKGDFVYPDKAPGPGSYPIDTRKRAIAALSRASDPGNSGELSTVQAKVYARYPDLKQAKGGK
jgi:hypothetical protein